MQYKFKNLHNDRSNVHIELHSFEQVPRYPFYHHLSHATKSEILLKRFLGPVYGPRSSIFDSVLKLNLFKSKPLF